MKHWEYWEKEKAGRAGGDVSRTTWGYSSFLSTANFRAKMLKGESQTQPSSLSKFMSQRPASRPEKDRAGRAEALSGGSYARKEILWKLLHLWISTKLCTCRVKLHKTGQKNNFWEGGIIE